MLLLLNTGTFTPDSDLVVAADWGRDGAYTGEDNITADVVEVSTRRGRDTASQYTGQAAAGSLTAALINTSGKYSPDYGSSPIFGQVKPGVPVRASALTSGGPVFGSKPIFTGVLDDITPGDVAGGLQTATLRASGNMIKLVRREIYLPAQTDAETGEIVNVILNEPGAFPLTQFEHVDTGQTAIPQWGVGKRSSLDLIRDLERSELGFFYERADGEYVFEDRHHRIKGDHLTSQATWKDGTGSGVFRIRAIRQESRLDAIRNTIVAKVRFYTTDALAVLWTYEGGNITLGPGEHIRMFATYPNDASGTTAAWVAAWTTPVAGVDFICSDGSTTDVQLAATTMGISEQRTATRMIVNLENTHATASKTITTLQARGTAVRLVGETEIAAENTASAALYGQHDYDLPGKWIPTVNIANDYCAYVLSKLKDPHPNLRIEMIASKDAAHMRECLNRELSDRVTVQVNGDSKLGINTDFFIESAEWVIRRGEPWIAVFTVSPASTEQAWVLGTSALGIDTVAGF